MKYPQTPESQRTIADLAMYKKRAHDFWKEVKTLRAEGAKKDLIIRETERKHRALWETLVKAYQREGCGLGEAQIIADVAMAPERVSTRQNKDG